MFNKSHKVVAIVGATASGKSELAVRLAKEFNGEIISADSRQVYRGLDVGSGKITPEEMSGVTHHLLSIANPADPELLTLSEYLRLARVKMDDILEQGKIPFIVGGTGLYITALTEGYQVPDVPPNTKLRGQLEKMSLEKLQDTYHTLDPKGFKKIDINNPRRLIRAIEVVKMTGKPFFQQTKKIKPDFETLTLGIDLPWNKLKKRIEQRLLARYPAMLEEVKKLHERGVTWQRLESFGLEYKWMTKLAKNEISESEALENLKKDIINYARRQLTWWRKRDVVWIKTYKEAREKTKKFLESQTKNDKYLSLDI